MNNPNCFPKGLDTHITLQGPCGTLEALTTSSTTENNFFTKTALLCHPHPLHGGSMHNKVIHTLSRAFHHCHYNTIRFNYRGVGKSTGQYGNYLGEIEDALAIVNWLKKTQSSHKIFLAGFSFGSYIAASLCHKISASGLITIAPAVNHKNYNHLLPIYCPWLIIHGAKDELVPLDEVLAFTKTISNKYKLNIINNSSHFFHNNLIILRNEIESYLKSLL